ncbi:MAG: nucleotidyltransferase family protein [Alphaproteobacteria bacterium]|nr:nucleotidyltransferase family protein [Alphaproteobacteria bacterium]
MSKAGVILAAGLSSRFPGNKLLARFRGEPIIRYVVKAALASRLDETVLVIGHQGDDLLECLSDLSAAPAFRIRRNARYLEGQSSSIQEGLSQVADKAEAVLFLTADQPLMTSAIIDRLIETHAKSKKAICLPRVQGARRNPVIFGKSLFGELMGLTGDKGGRALLDAHADDIAFDDFDDPTPFADIDTPEELVRMEKSR